MSVFRRQSRSEYLWTPRRIGVAAVILLGGVAVSTAMIVRFVRSDGLTAGQHIAFFDDLNRQIGDQMFREFNVENLTIDMRNVLSGGPPKDGIPSLVDPRVVPADESKFAGHRRVVGVTVNGHSRAYPLNILVYHEAINDRLGDVPIAVVYCPLCDSVSVLDRRLNGRTYEFGVSGMLVNSNVLLYDRTDNAFWSQVGMTAISGPNAGRSLEHLPWEIATLDAWRSTRAGATVVSQDTGHDRDYAWWPYESYFESEKLWFPVRPLNDRLALKTRIVGVELAGQTRAYPLDAVHEAPGGRIADVLGGQPVELVAIEGGVRVVSAPVAARVVHTFWFSWAAFHPETDVFGLSER